LRWWRWSVGGKGVVELEDVVEVGGSEVQGFEVGLWRGRRRRRGGGRKGLVRTDSISDSSI